MDIEALNGLQERLDQGSTRLLRERFPWIPFIKWKGRDNACVVVPQAGETVELQLINDAPKAMFIVHTCLMASKAEIDFLRRAVLLYTAAAAPSLPVKGLLLSLSVDAGAAKAATSVGIEVLPAIDDVQIKVTPSPRSERARSNSNASPRSPSTKSRLASTQTAPAPAPPPVAAPVVPALKLPPSPSSAPASVQKQWKDLLMAVGEDESTAETLARSFVSEGLAFPHNGATLDWDKLKKVPGVKLGQARRIMKHIGGQIPV